MQRLHFRPANDSSPMPIFALFPRTIVAFARLKLPTNILNFNEFRAAKFEVGVA